MRRGKAGVRVRAAAITQMLIMNKTQLSYRYNKSSRDHHRNVPIRQYYNVHGRKKKRRSESTEQYMLDSVKKCIKNV